MPKTLNQTRGQLLKKMNFTSDLFFDPRQTPTPAQNIFAQNLRAKKPTWLLLKEIKPLLNNFFDNLQNRKNHADCEANVRIGKRVFIGQGTKIEASAWIGENVWIGENCVIRAGAYLRENAIVGDGSIIGNASEIKNSIILPKAQVPHYNYVGDSLLGYRTHLGAGVILSNLRLDQKTIKISVGDVLIDTSLRKFGAIIGDFAEVGCNSVLNPGSILAKNSLIYPLTNWSGFLPEKSIGRNNNRNNIFPRQDKRST